MQAVASQRQIAARASNVQAAADQWLKRAELVGKPCILPSHWIAAALCQGCANCLLEPEKCMPGNWQLSRTFKPLQQLIR